MLLYVLYPILLVIYASCMPPFVFFFFFNDTATTEIYTLSLHDALPISGGHRQRDALVLAADSRPARDSSDVPAGRGDRRHGTRGDSGGWLARGPPPLAHATATDRPVACAREIGRAHV